MENPASVIFSADIEEEEEKKDGCVVQPAEAIQAVAWMEMVYKDAGLTIERANEAALIIQRAYKRYRVKRESYQVHRLESTKSMVVEAILENLRQKLFERVTSREDIPEEYGTREDMMIAGEKLQHTFKEHLRRIRVSEEDRSMIDEMKEEEWEGDEGSEDMEVIGFSRELDYHPLESERKSKAERVEDQSTAPGEKSQVMSEHIRQSLQLQSETQEDAEYFEDENFQEETDGNETGENEEHEQRDEE